MAEAEASRKGAGSLSLTLTLTISLSLFQFLLSLFFAQPMMARGSLMDPTFRVNRSPLPPERPTLSRRETQFFYDGSGDDEGKFHDSQEMPDYGDPAFSVDPRDNPHLRSRTDLPRMPSPVPPTYPDFEGGSEEIRAHPPHDSSRGKNKIRSRSPFPPQPPLTTSSASDSYSSSSNEHSPFPGSSVTSYQTSANNSRNVSPATSAEKVDRPRVKPQKSSQKSVRNSPRGDLDKVDRLDDSDPFGFTRHHHGPYQTVNDALTKRAPPTKTPSQQRKQKAQVCFLFCSLPASWLTSHQSFLYPQPQTHIPTSTSYTGGVLNLVPGQLMPKMPYQPEPPPDWVSPPPTVGRLPVVSPYPDQYSYNPADVVPQMAPHPSEYRPPPRYQSPMQSLSFPTLASLSPNPNTVLSITNPDPGSPLPTPQPPAPNHQYHHPPSSRKSRLSLPAQPRPHEFPKQSPLQKPSSDVLRTPSMPVASSPATSSRDKLAIRASGFDMNSQSYDAPHELQVETSGIHRPHDRHPVFHNQQSFNLQDSHLAPPDIRLPSAPSVMSSSTNSSKKSGKGLPRHVPKKLVMPTPLQPLQNLNQSQGLVQENIGSTNSVYYPPPHSHTSPPTSSVSMSTSTHTHQRLHSSKSRKSHYGGFTTREMQVVRASGFYPPPISQSKSQRRQSTGIQPSLSVHAPPVAASDRSDPSATSNRELEREHRRSRRQTVMYPGVGTYLEAKASSNGFQSSVGSRSTKTSNSGISGSRSERHRGRNHHRASSDGYRTGYESSSHGGRHLDVYGHSDPNLPVHEQYSHHQPEVYAYGYDPRASYDNQQGHRHDSPPRDHHRERRERRERRDRDRERGRSHRHTKSYPNGIPPSQPHSPPSQQPQMVQEVPVTQDDKHTRHTLRKRATLNGQGMSWTISVNDAGVAVASPVKEKQRSRNKSQSHLGHGGAEGISSYLDVPGLREREKSSQSAKVKKSPGFGLVSLFRSLSTKEKEEKEETEKERTFREWAAAGAGTAISNASSKSGRKLSKVRSRN